MRSSSSGAHGKSVGCRILSWKVRFLLVRVGLRSRPVLQGCLGYVHPVSRAEFVSEDRYRTGRADSEADPISLEGHHRNVDVFPDDNSLAEFSS